MEILPWTTSNLLEDPARVKVGTHLTSEEFDVVNTGVVCVSSVHSVQIKFSVNKFVFIAIASLYLSGTTNTNIHHMM